MSLQYERALEEWRGALGREHVATDRAVLDSAGKATFETRVTVPALLRPANTREVRAALLIADKFRLSVYPISSGKNWGYGSRVPTADNCALLDLGRMNRIVDFNEDLAYVTIEPGVTQRQLFEFLRERKSRLWMDATGSSPDCSIIGNTVERGFGHTPYADHCANMSGLEVVLPNGDIVQTGFSGHADCHTGAVYKWGLGPSVDGLFSQSNLGVVTRMTVWLMPAPERCEAFFFRCDRPEMLQSVINALRPLRMNGTLRSSIHIGNDYKVLSGLQQFPWDHTGGRTPLTRDHMVHFRRSLKFGCWNGSGALYGTRAQVAEARRLVRRALKGCVSKLQFVDEAKLAIAERFSGIYQLATGWDLSRTLELASPLLGLMKGVPTTKSLDSVYWRKRQPVPVDANPDRDGCGLLWLAPVVPLDGGHALRVSNMAIEALEKYGFEPMLSLSLVTERAIACVISITYDRQIPGEDARAAECNGELMNSLVVAGYPPYRLGIHSMGKVPTSEGLAHLISKVREITDPNGILAPGRYETPSANVSYRFANSSI